MSATQVPATPSAERRPTPRTEEAWPPSSDRRLPNPSAPRSDEAPSVAAQPSSPAAPADDAPKRHLDQELTALLRPRDCLDMAAAAAEPGGRLTLHVDAVVMPSGRISRASVMAAGQPQPALRCLGAQLEQAALKPPIQEAPRHVTGTVKMEAKVLPETRQAQP